MKVRGRVELVFFPERLVARLNPKRSGGRPNDSSEALQERHAFIQRLVEQQGMGGQLRSGNLLTGQFFIALDFFRDAAESEDRLEPRPARRCLWFQAASQDIEDKLTGIVAKLDKLPLRSNRRRVRKALRLPRPDTKGSSQAVNRIDTDVTPDLKTIASTFCRGAIRLRRPAC